MSTTFATASTATHDCFLVDAKGQILGRLASRLALLLRGKHKATYTPFIDTGDVVVVINAGEIAVTGNKRTQKTYDRYSGYPSGRKTRTLDDVLKTHPERVLETAVKGMLPHGPMGRRMFGKLKVYAGASHPHAAQQPKPVPPHLISSTHHPTT